MKNETKSTLKGIILTIFAVLILMLLIHWLSTPRQLVIQEDSEHISYRLPVTDAYDDFLD